ncbi:hypothetical protein GUITHDRAFT_150822 [Guillardia theta CCMP2712]|uniref:Uncharacterized protein n=2 Tax=Guillardia theta TaxID=55529 RepID=L1JU59_GUITC|nr:hypothetical protein GUITHDRAFT_150822 [Guillardia theta CCMP2712]EKX51824.1 hypothetical protein GUITHDRAFT_150822 [Guillardia theta CCMP2712]|eukprot:XP_005838804.1 hypothetical protein GUITHDRAFT_150822 [Guillardia theta CCMP2712]
MPPVMPSSASVAFQQVHVPCTARGASLLAHGQASDAMRSNRRSFAFPVLVPVVQSLCFPVADRRGMQVSDACIQSIAKECRPMIEAVRRSGGHLLYRGYDEATCKRVKEEADLLDPATYGEDGARFFLAMEQWLKERPSFTRSVRPSCGHIGSADHKVAARWGIAHSCWPAGSFSYGWLRGSDIFYPPSVDVGEENAGHRDFFERNMVVDEGLDFALRHGKEIMFASDHYWIVPSDCDGRIRELLT